jgi:hypothetical protein
MNTANDGIRSLNAVELDIVSGGEATGAFAGCKASGEIHGVNNPPPEDDDSVGWGGAVIIGLLIVFGPR